MMGIVNKSKNKRHPLPRSGATTHKIAGAPLLSCARPPFNVIGAWRCGEGCMESNRGISTDVRRERLEGLDGASPYLVARLTPPPV